ncbi:uncharacterized protein AMSG_05520 [Thecamonas trahens ATCC 50062]|uniref:HSF-type DNA-binding domain-containing protein n=1 Tax=Thecamonas trahens ATCC 50062 TaxID=461836 RepID=A0A0L0DAZ2_THETB|nr:hypothetical protein AMSG_05520 [Thecamonas trahens ATCC 50062]KNC49502.1 hypothetical protein AMSG_05520 [Thecamonas trahens ATCC 50062]|eukprot:XP_013757619.1 hypothetical protein AMSG_05520 [Thecamonas trahens ATCC 50062]
MGKPKVTRFLQSAYTMISTCTSGVVGWSDEPEEGIGFEGYIELSDPAAAATELRKYYKHGNVGSFSRQLNMYSFKTRKQDNRLWFHHVNFQPDAKDRLALISRKPVYYPADKRKGKGSESASGTSAGKESAKRSASNKSASKRSVSSASRAPQAGRSSASIASSNAATGMAAAEAVATARSGSAQAVKSSPPRSNAAPRGPVSKAEVEASSVLLAVSNSRPMSQPGSRTNSRPTSPSVSAMVNTTTMAMASAAAAVAHAGLMAMRKRKHGAGPGAPGGGSPRSSPRASPRLPFASPPHWDAAGTPGHSGFTSPAPDHYPGVMRSPGGGFLNLTQEAFSRFSPSLVEPQRPDALDHNLQFDIMAKRFYVQLLRSLYRVRDDLYGGLVFSQKIGNREYVIRVTDKLPAPIEPVMGEFIIVDSSLEPVAPPSTGSSTASMFSPLSTTGSSGPGTVSEFSGVPLEPPFGVSYTTAIGLSSSLDHGSPHAQSQPAPTDISGLAQAVEASPGSRTRRLSLPRLDTSVHPTAKRRKLLSSGGPQLLAREVAPRIKHIPWGPPRRWRSLTGLAVEHSSCTRVDKMVKYVAFRHTRDPSFILYHPVPYNPQATAAQLSRDLANIDSLDVEAEQTSAGTVKNLARMNRGAAALAAAINNRLERQKRLRLQPAAAATTAFRTSPLKPVIAGPPAAATRTRPYRPPPSPSSTTSSSCWRGARRRHHRSSSSSA